MNFDGWFEHSGVRIDLVALVRVFREVEKKHGDSQISESWEARLEDYNKFLGRFSLKAENTYQLEQILDAGLKRWEEVASFIYPESAGSPSSVESGSLPSAEKSGSGS